MTEKIKMYWEGAIRADLVDGWTTESLNRLTIKLDEAVEDVFAEIESDEMERKPLARVILEGDGKYE
jgi:hypothetical protein